ncbi:MAG: thioesterase superfamily protein [Blastococcus sp.]|jgi:1,4-dihydroxy-2-naphthoyl-CoA hydrolase|nr:thioesterase superfamily protein [Blastococcus sp.]
MSAEQPRTDRPPVGMPAVDLASSSRFTAATGFELTDVSGTRVTGWAELGPDQHTPWGVVHGGVYCSIIESAASIGASASVAPHGKFSVGVNNNTDFIRAMTAGRIDVVAEPIQQGRTQQLWQVLLTRAEDGKLVARGQVRLQNVVVPGGAAQRG